MIHIPLGLYFRDYKKRFRHSALIKKRFLFKPAVTVSSFMPAAHLLPVEKPLGLIQIGLAL